MLTVAGVLWLTGTGIAVAAPLTPQSLPALSPGTVFGRPGGAGTALTAPVVTSGAAAYGVADFIDKEGKYLGAAGTIDVHTAKAILAFSSGNLSRDSRMNINQPDASSTLLVRITDPNGNPSLIQGAINANGQLYLVNRNGILFGNGAQVDVGSLVASALNISDDAFNNGLFSIDRRMYENAPFVWGGDRAGFLGSLVRVENGASIHSANGGFVMLLGPRVENSGAITTPGGQAVLAAGAKVYLAAIPEKVEGTPSADSGYHGFLVEVDAFSRVVPVLGKDGKPELDENNKPKEKTLYDHGTVLNAANGTISAPRGNVTLVGYAINQEGRISATTSINQNGIVRLLARDTNFDATGSPNITGSGGYVAGSQTGSVVLGQGSKIEITPEETFTKKPDGSSEVNTIQDAQKFNSSIVDVEGGNIRMQGGSSIKAAGGTVNFAAQAGLKFMGDQAAANGSRVYLEAGSVIDVAGTQGVQVSAARNIVEVDLRGSVVQDYPLIRDSALYGKKVWVDVRKGTRIADISGYVAQIGRTVAEKTTGGGTVNIRSEGDIVLRNGSLIDFSGGSVDYAGGPVHTTRLVSQGKLVDIAKASPNAIYTGITGEYTIEHPKWGVTETFKTMGQMVYSPAYREGKNAGEASFIAKGLALDGALLGKATPELTQRDAGRMPLPGKVTIGSSASTGQYGLPDVVFKAQKAQLPAGFDSNGASQSGETVTISTDALRDGGIGRLAVYSKGKITLPDGVALDMAPGSGLKADGAAETSSVTLNGSQLDVAGSIHVLAGDIALTSSGSINLGGGSELAARGAWANDNHAVDPAAGTAPLLIDGGSIKLQASGDVVLAAGSLIDVSGGAKADAKGKLTGGSGGSISIGSASEAFAPGDSNSPSLTLGGELRGYGVGTLTRGGKGGTLNLTAQSARIGAARAPGDTAPEGELLLDPAFFRKGGFAAYKISGQNNLTVAAGSEVHPLASRLILGSAAANRRSGGNPYNFSQPQLLPVDQRQPASISLEAISRVYGSLTLEKGAAIRVDPTGSVSLASGKQLNVPGSVDAPAGKISLGTGAPGENDDYNPDQSIWIGGSARLSATGYAKYIVNNTGLRQGEVLRGGDITISSGKGYVVAENGSVIDVSGLAPVTLDLLRENGGAGNYAPVSVAGDAGSITIAAREGAFLDGALLGKAGGGQAAGGALTLSLLRPPSPKTGENTFPVAPVSIVVQNEGNSVPVGLKAGDRIDNGNADRNGKAFITTQTVMAGGFDSLALKSQNNIEFRGSVDATLRRSIMLDAPNLASAGGGQVNLNAAHVSLGRSDPASQAAAKASAGGSGRLAVNANLIDIEGLSAWQGFARGSFASTGDIRLKGVYNTQNPDDLTLKGGLDIGGDLEFTAKQIYPTSLSDFALTASNSPGAITVKQWAPGQDSPVLSAGGRLTLNAAGIMQQGVLKAPFGNIVLNGDSVTLAPGSVTSVSAEGLTIPFGRTQLSGLEYAYGFNGASYSQNMSAAPPEKSVQLNGKAVDVQSGATVNLAGGGDLYAYEFIPGRGGSKDVLDPLNAPDTYAILPWLKSAAPYDYQEYQSGEVKSNLKAGDSIYLSAAGDLKAGFYTLMPARYALLDKAYLVTPVAGRRDMLSSQSFQQLDGARIVPGYRVTTGYDGSLIRDVRTSGFAVAPGASARTRAEYRNTYASSFYAASTAAQMPADAGRLSVNVANALALNGTFRTAAGSGGRGAEVDISSSNIAIGSGGDPLAVTLDADTLNHLGAASLLIGGARSPGSDGVNVTVGADTVTVNGGAELAASEIILAATGEVTVKDGAKVEGKGQFSGRPKNIAVTNAGSGNSYGALLRVSSGGQVTVARPGTINDADGHPVDGRLTVENGAGVYADKSVMLDANVDSSIASGSVTFGDHAELGMGARRISLGDAGAVTEGVAFTNTDLAGFNRLDRLSLTSYSTLDLYGNVVLGNDALNLDIQSAGIRGLQGGKQDAAIHADTLTLSNPSGIKFVSAAGAALGDGNMTVTANKVVLGKGGKTADGTLRGVTIKGFDNVTLAARREITGSGAGRLDVTGNLAMQAARLTGTRGAQQMITASGAANFTRPAGADNRPVAPDPALLADLRKVNALGAHIGLQGDSVKVDGAVDLAAGKFGATATHGVTLTENAQINAGGATVQFIDTVAHAPGGSVGLTSDSGNVTIKQGAVVDVSGADGGDAGALAIRAANGEAYLDGVLKGYANPDAQGRQGKQGRFSQDVAKLGSFSKLHAKLAPRSGSDGKVVEGGFTEAVNVRVRDGDVRVASTDRVKAHDFTLEADNGNIEVNGGIDASGSKGGSIGLYASGNVTVSGAKLDAYATEAGVDTAGTAGRGGRVTLATTGGVLDIHPDSWIDVSGKVAGFSSASDVRNAAATASWNVLLIDAVRQAVSPQLDLTDAAVQAALNEVINSAAKAAGNAVITGNSAASAGSAAGMAVAAVVDRNAVLQNVVDVLKNTVGGVVANSGYFAAAQTASSSAAAQLGALSDSSMVRSSVLGGAYTAGAPFIATAALARCGSSCDSAVSTAVNNAVNAAMAAHGNANTIADAVVAALPAEVPGSVKDNVRTVALNAVKLNINAARAAADAAFGTAGKYAFAESGQDATGKGGSIVLRAPRTGAGTGVAVNLQPGAANNMKGASEIVVEAVKTYGQGSLSGDLQIGSASGLKNKAATAAATAVATASWKAPLIDAINKAVAAKVDLNDAAVQTALNDLVNQAAQAAGNAILANNNAATAGSKAGSKAFAVANNSAALKNVAGDLNTAVSNVVANSGYYAAAQKASGSASTQVNALADSATVRGEVLQDAYSLGATFIATTALSACGTSCNSVLANAIAAVNATMAAQGNASAIANAVVAALPAGVSGPVINEVRAAAQNAVKLNINAARAAADAAFGVAGSYVFTDVIRAEADQFAANSANITTRLGAGVHLRPGVEIRAPGDMTLASLWDLYGWRFNDGAGNLIEPGVLTLRAGGNLNIDRSLSDGFNTAGITGNKNFTLATLADTNSWSYRLAAGADLGAANPLAVKPLAEQQDKKGSLMVAKGIGYKSATTTAAADAVAKTLTAIRTGTGDIDIAAGRDVVLGNAESVIYTAGRPDSLARDFYPYTFFGTNSSGHAVYYPRQGGDVSIRAQGNVEGAVSGLTTAGRDIPMQMISDWLYRRGKVDDNGKISSSNTPGFNTLSTTWLIYFPRFEQNIGALGGGDVSVVADGSINNLSVVIPTNAWLSGKAGDPALASNLRVNGGGDLTVRAGQDIAGGMFYVSQGKGMINAGNSLLAGTHQVNTGTATDIVVMQDIHPILALDNGSFQVQAGNDLNLEAVVNATVVGQVFGNSRGRATSNNIDGAALTNFYTYAQDSSISLKAISGNLYLTNNNDVIKAAAPQLYAGSTTYGRAAGDVAALSIYPPNLHAAALQGGITVSGSPTLFPSASGALELLAQGAVTVSDTLRLADADPAALSTALHPTGKAGIPTSLPGGFTTLLHQGDDNPIRVYALTGDITGGKAYFPKQARLAAGRDIVDFGLIGQNLRAGDVTGLTAGRDIKFTTRIDKNGNPEFASDKGLTLGGPGRLEVVAGRNVDLGGSSGIVTRGNIDNFVLPDSGANIAVMAGVNSAPDYAGFSSAYSGYRDAGFVAGWQAAHPGEAVPDRVKNTRYDLGATAGYSTKLAYAFFDQLKLAGTEHNAGKEGKKDDAGHVMGYERGYQAAAALFPDKSYQGDINLFFSQIKTEHGGDIELMVPGGLINAGLANPAYKATVDKSNDKSPKKNDPSKWMYISEALKTPDQLGIVTVDGGSIRSFTRGDFLVNQSRVFTLGGGVEPGSGGDILLWSSEGNIDAGKGAKTASAAPPPQIKLDTTGAVIVDITNAVSGSGIGVLLAKDGVVAGSTDLIAPKGEVNAGDAGIRAAGDLNIAALRVVGAENIQFSGAATGVPTASVGGLDAGLSNLGNTADVAKAASETTKSLASNSQEESMQRIQQAMNEFRPSFVTVEVIGLGEDGEEKERNN